jgi:ankyrin
MLLPIVLGVSCVQAQPIDALSDAGDGVALRGRSAVAAAPLAARDASLGDIVRGGPITAPSAARLPASEQALMAHLLRGDGASALKHLRSANPRLDVVDEAWRTPLTLAIRLGDVPLVREMLRRGAPTEQRGHEGMTPLGLAAYLGQDTMVRELLRQGAEPIAISQRGQTPLHLALTGGQLGAARLLLAARPAVQWQRLYNASGRHPLAEAAHHGRLEGVRLLQQHGVALSEPDQHGLDALHAAALGRQVHVADALIEQGAQPIHPLTVVLLAQMREPLPAPGNTP